MPFSEVLINGGEFPPPTPLSLIKDEAASFTAERCEAEGLRDRDAVDKVKRINVHFFTRATLPC